MKLALVLCAIVCSLLHLSPAFAQNNVLSVQGKFRSEINNKKMLRGIDTIVLIVKRGSLKEPAYKDNEAIAVDVDALRKLITAKLNAAGIKAIAETTEADKKLSSLPKFVFQVSANQATVALGTTSEQKTYTFWSMVEDMYTPMLPYKQVTETSGDSPVDVYQVSVWQTSSYASSDSPEAKLTVETFRQQIEKPVDEFIRDWRIANNKPLIHSLPKH